MVYICQYDIINSPKLIDCNNPEMFRKNIKISKEKSLRSCISMYHYKSGCFLIAFKCNSVDKPRFITGRPKPPDLRPWRSSANINMFLCVWSPVIQFNIITINNFIIQ